MREDRRCFNNPDNLALAVDWQVFIIEAKGAKAQTIRVVMSGPPWTTTTMA